MRRNEEKKKDAENRIMARNNRKESGLRPIRGSEWWEISTRREKKRRTKTPQETKEKEEILYPRRKKEAAIPPKEKYGIFYLNK